MRRMHHILQKMILPCCLRSYCYDAAHINMLAKCVGVPAEFLKRHIEENMPIGDWRARRIHEATDGLLKAQSIPKDMTAGYIQSLPAYQRREWCSCKHIETQ